MIQKKALCQKKPNIKNLKSRSLTCATNLHVQLAREELESKIRLEETTNMLEIWLGIRNAKNIPEEKKQELFDLTLQWAKIEWGEETKIELLGDTATVTNQNRQKKVYTPR